MKKQEIGFCIRHFPLQHAYILAKKKEEKASLPTILLLPMVGVSSARKQRQTINAKLVVPHSFGPETKSRQDWKRDKHSPHVPRNAAQPLHGTALVQERHALLGGGCRYGCSCRGLPGVPRRVEAFYYSRGRDARTGVKVDINGGFDVFPKGVGGGTALHWRGGGVGKSSREHYRLSFSSGLWSSWSLLALRRGP